MSNHVLRRVAIAPIRIYQQVISPLLPDACIYYPTCSQYAVQDVYKRQVALELQRDLLLLGQGIEAAKDVVVVESDGARLALGLDIDRLLRKVCLLYTSRCV